jgi:Family of unknown function (DUF6229)
MKDTLVAEELVARWRNGGEQNNPAGPLFVAGEFAEVDITNDCGTGCGNTCGSQCTGSGICFCC